MTRHRPLLPRTLGVAHILVAILLLPVSTFLGLFSAMIVIPALLWLMLLGIRLWQPDKHLKTSFRYTHLVLAPIALLLVVYGIGMLRAAERSAEAGGGLLGAIGLIPLAMGVCAGTLSLVSLYVSYSTTFQSERKS